MAVTVNGGPPWFGTPEKLFEGDYVINEGGSSTRPYDICLDGQRFLMIKRPQSADIAATPAFVVGENWTEELKRLVPK
jgi:hypothetical protein